MMKFAKLIAISSCRFLRLRSLKVFVVISVLAFFFAIAWIPIPNALSQFPPLPPSNTTPISSSTITIHQLGDIDYAWVKLDGRNIFRVASPTVFNQDKDENTAPIIQRVKRIENTLSAIFRIGFDIDTLQVKQGILNNQTIILVSDAQQLQERVILTITEPDTQLYGEPDHSQLAIIWSQQLQKALQKAYQERQPQYLQKQLWQVGRITLGIIVVSLILISVEKRFKVQWKLLKEQSSSLVADTPIHQGEATLGNEIKLAAARAFQLLTNKLQEITLERKININILTRRLLQFLQIFIWLGGIAWILQLFPYTRASGLWLLGRPIPILLIWLIVTLANQGSDVLIDYYLKTWVENTSFTTINSQRHSLRAPTFATALKGMTTFVFSVLGIILILDQLSIPVSPVLAGAGIIGFAISFASQSLIKDVINGCLILWEDQYVVGDVIAIGNVSGLVENMNLRITQLRNLEGELITIPNSSIGIVRNMSNGWSRVNFAIEVSYSADEEKVIHIMKQVANQLYHDREWQQYILEPPEVLGIDNISHKGTLIRLLIKTQPIQQWSVGREFRRRLKQAFNEHNIPIGVPQQLLEFKDYPDFIKNEEKSY